VKKHATPDDLWLVIHGSVYDVTSFLKDHPGGEEVGVVVLIVNFQFTIISLIIF
jgi:cytochrome b involved in lipid metabolism